MDLTSLWRLQLVQNSAASCLQTGKRKCGHVTPLLASLHWLPVRFRINFKILLPVFKVLNGLAPLYLAELLHHHSPARALRSTNQMLLDVLRSRHRNRKGRAIAVAAPNLWKSLPIHIWTAQTLATFKLKTHDLLLNCAAR